jgi:hypothetical protein
MWRRLHLHRLHRHPLPWVVLTVGGVSLLLTPNQEIIMGTKLSMGHTLALAIAYLDQNGNPLLVAPIPDAPPTWSNTTAATETLAASADGLTCVGTPLAPGNDTVSLGLVVNGVSFAATLGVEVDPAPQVLTAVAIAATVGA